MSLLTRLFQRREDPREAWRPLWHRVVEIAREKRWYAELGVVDSVEGRFDMITAILAVVLLRMEREEALVAGSVYLTELFVEDMDGQLRESGVGDVVVGKHLGRLMSAMGGRLGAYREALAIEDNRKLVEALERNVSLVEGSDANGLAQAMRDFHSKLSAIAVTAIMAGEI